MPNRQAAPAAGVALGTRPSPENLAVDGPKGINCAPGGGWPDSEPERTIGSDACFLFFRVVLVVDEFMAQKASAAKSKSKSSIREIVGQVIMGTTVLLAIGAGFAAVVTYRKIEARVAERVAEPVKIVFEWPLISPPSTAGTVKAASGDKAQSPVPITWLSQRTQQDLTDLAGRMVSENPFDRASLADTCRALESTGWFKKIDFVRREAGGVVRIRGSWRIPGAVVRREGFDHVVSLDGERLPLDYREGKTGGSLKALINSAYPPPLAGERWPGGDVQAGLALIGQLHGTVAWPQVAAVDISNYAKNKRLIIITDRGNQVVWGSAPGEFNPNEPDAATKLRRLTTLVSSPDFEQRIDGGKAIIYLTGKRGFFYDSTATPKKPDEQPENNNLLLRSEDGAAGGTDRVVRTVADHPQE